jgi:hypothetical protein
LLAVLAFAAPVFANSIAISTPPGGYLYYYGGTAEGFARSFYDYTAFYATGGITNGNITTFSSGLLELVNDQNFNNETIIDATIFKGVFNSLTDTFRASFSGWEYASAAGYVDVTGTYVVTGVNSYSDYGFTYQMDDSLQHRRRTSFAAGNGLELLQSTSAVRSCATTGKRGTVFAKRPRERRSGINHGTNKPQGAAGSNQSNSEPARICGAILRVASQE